MAIQSPASYLNDALVSKVVESLYDFESERSKAGKPSLLNDYPSPIIAQVSHRETVSCGLCTDCTNVL